MLKLMILLHRREGMSVEDFRRYWRESHSPLLRQLPGLQRLVFNHGLADETGGAPAYDGISEDWFESVETAQAAMASAAGQAVAADTPNFVDLSRLRVIAVEEEEIPLAPVATQAALGSSSRMVP
jgi:uncharacterized protein (TIGR02118 family)